MITREFPGRDNIDGSLADDLTKLLDDAVVEIRSNTRWRKRIMTLEQYAKEQAKEETKRILTLVDFLIEAGRLEEVKALSKDEELQEKLLKEYNLID